MLSTILAKHSGLDSNPRHISSTGCPREEEERTSIALPKPGVPYFDLRPLSFGFVTMPFHGIKVSQLLAAGKEFFNKIQ